MMKRRVGSVAVGTRARCHVVDLERYRRMYYVDYLGAVSCMQLWNRLAGMR